MIPALSRARSFADALEKGAASADFSLTDGVRVPLLAALLGQHEVPALLAITATSREASSIADAFRAYRSDAQVLSFPAWETLPHERLSPSAETVGTRLATLRALSAWDGSRPIIVVASVRAALQPLAPDLGALQPVRLTRGGRGYGLAELSTQLVEHAYTRVDMVTRRGEFAVRGGILDVFPPDAEHPVRADFFGDELDELRAFSVADQRSLPGELDAIDLPPSRELLLTPEVRHRARQLEAEYPTLAPLLAKIAEGIPSEGMESLAPVLVPRLVPRRS